MTRQEDGPATVVELLENALHRHQVLVRLTADHTGIAIEEADGRVTDNVRHAVLARQPEVLAHLLGSPGIHIVGYPAEFMLASHGFQAIRIAERRKRHKVVEVFANGQAFTRWFDDPPGWRLREIADELGLHKWSEVEGPRWP